MRQFREPGLTYENKDGNFEVQSQLVKLRLYGDTKDTEFRQYYLVHMDEKLRVIPLYPHLPRCRYDLDVHGKKKRGSGTYMKFIVDLITSQLSPK